MTYRTIAVLGGTGFVGRQLVARLAASGHDVRVATRRLRHAQRLGTLRVSVAACDVHDPAQLARFLRGADAVINLVGILHGGHGTPYGPGFAEAHVALPRKMVEACTQLGIRRLLHMSALGADPAGPSMYFRSRGDGEAVVRDAPGIATTIMRPSVIFGPDDHLLTVFAAMQQRFPVIPLACASARFQPIHVGDVTQAFATALDLPGTAGKTYDLGGPDVYTLAELVRIAGELSGHPRRIWALPRWLGRAQATFFERLPGPLLTRDNLDSMSSDAVLQAPLADELRLTPVSLAAAGPSCFAARGRVIRRGGDANQV
ncbi:complex I NDUFA9 subunit family protein [Chitinasiproducens palmae]|uniref:NADH dehydrogenase n=1 Tax=Chitinasiproducens palmae TaxID=1770053 RepID=A0A1H2PTB4_9BURK|nr:complex I NDUFA9 subunit family protein [Chitinasiproducens palmae]SDV50328.1 NADH dehydrogenase [Chitinasiproducens palmae]